MSPAYRASLNDLKNYIRATAAGAPLPNHTIPLIPYASTAEQRFISRIVHGLWRTFRYRASPAQQHFPS